MSLGVNGLEMRRVSVSLPENNPTVHSPFLISPVVLSPASLFLLFLLFHLVLLFTPAVPSLSFHPSLSLFCLLE